ncbi:Bug family tripartite tricarboxylate transporter substrate binding protein [Comamonas sp. GB3 AK4-5]|uniref:Bug family tripartite tricarboxylate transporter substrate binding protein n=1 Tax=Comamonas sp. GB3 AK4-5 TaxID=3231487 RepID=UPI00351F3DF5
MPTCFIRTALQAAAFTTLLLTSAAQAGNNYPERPITLVVGFPPGGGADAVARIVGDQLGRNLGQPIIIENKPGAGTTMASSQVAKSPADGYTILLAGVSLHGSDQYLFKSANYDAANSFTPITRLVSAPLLIGVSAKLPYQNVQDLVAAAKKAPGKMSYGHSGVGVFTHTTGLQFMTAAGIDVLAVPFRGGAQAIQAVGAGDVDMKFATPPSILPLAQAGKIRLIAVTQSERSKLFPELPAMKESGLGSFSQDFWFGLYAPAGLSEPIKAKLFAAAQKTLQDDKVREKLEKSGNAPSASESPEQFKTWALAQGKLALEYVKKSGATSN